MSCCLDGRCLVCRADWTELARRLALTVACEVCGREVPKVRGQQAYCSPVCRSRARRKTDRASPEPLKRARIAAPQGDAIAPSDVKIHPWAFAGPSSKRARVKASDDRSTLSNEGATVASASLTAKTATLRPPTDGQGLRRPAIAALEHGERSTAEASTGGAQRRLGDGRDQREPRVT